MSLEDTLAELFCIDWPEEEYDILEQAVQSRCYPRIYARLRKLEEPFSPRRGACLCFSALHHGLNRKAFQAILDHCPAYSVMWDEDHPGFGAVELAARENRADILDLLLQRGGNINRHSPGWDSPLECTVEYGALDCLERLLREPELDVTMTPKLLDLWSLADMENILMDFCLQMAAPRLLGRDSTVAEPIPLPDELTVSRVAAHANWKLVSRLCRERGTIPAEDGREALDQFPRVRRADLEEDQLDVLFGPPVETDNTACAAALDSLLTACPSLLRRRKTDLLLVEYYLYRPETRSILEHRLKAGRRRRVLLSEFGSAQSLFDVCDFLRLWKECLPDRPVPAINRNTEVFGRLMGDIWEKHTRREEEEALEFLFQTCVFLPGRRPKPGEISSLALTLLHAGSTRLIEEQLRPGGVLEGEDPEVLLRFSRSEECSWLVRAVLTAYVKRRNCYEL